MNGGLMKAAGHGAIAVLAGLLMCTTSATAADLGGNCCADLEERVAELEATTARKGNRRVSLTISGQVNTAIMAWDDGLQNKTYIVDNGVSRSGFAFDGSAKINPSLTAGFQMVVGLATGARSHQTTQWDDDGGADTDGTIAMELANWYIDDKRLGSVRLGRINTAQSGSTIVDLGGVGVIANANFGLWQSGMFLNQGGVQVGTVAPVTWNNLFGGSFVSVSALSRQNAISYTTPTLHGFAFSAAYGEDEFWDAALRYAGEFSGFRVAGAISYSVNRDLEPDAVIAPTTEQDLRKWQGSASVLHVASGLFLSGAYVNMSYHGNTPFELNLTTAENRPDTTFWMLLGGVTRNWTGMGNTALYGEYGHVEDGAAGVGLTATGGVAVTLATVADLITSTEASYWGIGIVQNIDAAAMELYLSYRQYSGEATGDAANPTFVGPIDLEDFSVVMGGARIRF